MKHYIEKDDEEETDDENTNYKQLYRDLSLAYHGLEQDYYNLKNQNELYKKRIK